MPVTTIPLVGALTTRNTDAWASLSKDQRFINCIFADVPDNISGSRIVYAMKRPGWGTNSTPASGSTGFAVYQTVFRTSRRIFSVFGTAASPTLYQDTTACGVVSFNTTTEIFITEVIINDVKYIIVSGVGAVYFLSEDAFAAGLTFTADRTAASATLANVSSFLGLIVGQAISGTGIAANARIASLNPGGSSLTMTLDATSGAGTPTTITREYVAEIISAGFPSVPHGQVLPMDGFLFSGTATAEINNSDVNSIIAWSASSKIPTTFSSTVGSTFSQPFGIWRIKNYIVAIGAQFLEFFQNAGNSFGSVLTRVLGSTVNIGANSIKSVTQVIDDVYFVSSESGGTNGLFKISGNSVEKVSDQILDNILSSVSATPSSATSRLSSTFLNGLPTLLLTVSQNSAYTSFILYPTRGLWSEWTGSIPWVFANTNSSFFNFPDSTLGKVALLAVSDLLTSGKVYSMSMASPVYQDDGAAYTMTIQTQPYALNQGLPFIIDNINLLADTQSSGSTLLESSADDYATFGTIGSFALTSQQKNLPCGGYYDTSVAFRLTDAGNNAWRGQALQITWRPA